jgi:pyridoxine 4-dehydrogenase
MTTTLHAGLSGTFTLGDLRVHRLGFGAMRITGPGIWGPPVDHAEALTVLRRAVELGITLIDTANSYGPHVSESLIAEALHPYPADLIIATKGGLERPGPNQWEPNGRTTHLRSELEGSLRRLKVEAIDLYQLHRVDPAVPADEQFSFLAQIKREGKVRHVGLSEVGVDQIKQARQHVPIVSVQNKFNLVEREWEPVLDYCTSEHLAFIPWFPLQVGRVGEQGGAVVTIAQKHGVTPSQIALAWLLQRSPVMLPIPGTSRVKHLEENVAAAGLRLSADEMKALG